MSSCKRILTQDHVCMRSFCAPTCDVYTSGYIVSYTRGLYSSQASKLCYQILDYTACRGINPLATGQELRFLVPCVARLMHDMRLSTIGQKLSCCTSVTMNTFDNSLRSSSASVVLVYFILHRVHPRHRFRFGNACGTPPLPASKKLLLHQPRQKVNCAPHLKKAAFF